MADVISAVLRSGIFQLETPDELRGRVSSVHILVVTSGPRIGDAEAAAVAAVFGPRFSVVSGGILCLAGLAGVVRAFPELMRYRPSPREPTLKSAAEIVRLPFEHDSSETEIDPPIGWRLARRRRLIRAGSPCPGSRMRRRQVFRVLSASDATVSA